MARIRSVHPSICQSEDMVDVPAEVERTYVRLWTHCDDEGRCRDNVRLIKAGIFPLHDDVTLEVLDDHLEELFRRGHVVRYEVEGKGYIEVRAWAEYQKPQRPSPSKMPAPEGGDVRAPRGVRELSASPRGLEGRGVGEGGDTRDRDETALELVPSPGSSAGADGVRDFDSWWAAYPRKVDKAKARAAYMKARRRVGSDVLASSLERQRAVWDREHRPMDKMPHATTWLNGERWDDEALTADGGDSRVNELGQVER